MSYDWEWGPWGPVGFTEDEISAGVHWLAIRGSLGDEEPDFNEEKYEEKERIRREREAQAVLARELKQDVTKSLAALSTYSQIKNKAIKKLFGLELDSMIERYRREENLPFDYAVVAANHRDCLQALIKRYLAEEVGYWVHEDLDKEIEEFCEQIKRNDDLLIVYDRVTKIQSYVHKKIEDRHGAGSHNNIDIEPIRNLLSTCRLYLNLADIRYKDIHSLAFLISESEKASGDVAHGEEETPADRPFFIRPDARFLPTYRWKKLRSLVSYMDPRVSNKIFDIYKLDHDIPINEFRKKVIDIYLDPRYIRFSKYVWEQKISGYYYGNVSTDGTKKQVKSGSDNAFGTPSEDDLIPF